MAPLDYEIELQVVSEGYDRETEWFQPRIGIIPPTTAVLTVTRAQLWGSDVFTAIREFRSEDFGRTWSAPVIHETLDRRVLPDGAEVCPCDLTPVWHAPSGKLLMTGHTATYAGGERGGLLIDNRHTRDLVYSVYDADARRWADWRILEPPDRERFWWISAGCAQRVDLPSGDVLLPVSVMSRAEVGENFWKGCFATTVLRCRFDGETLAYLEQGNEMSVPEPRGLCEPSLTDFDGRYRLTLRNDVRGYVTTGIDGLHFDAPVPWRFDDGEELGSYNTQQHWVTHSDGLFLTYTRRGAGNDHVIRHRAPLFIAQVDPERMVVLRATERILVPDRGAQLGNFGVVDASRDETWVVTSEGMHGDAEKPQELARSEARGANNRIWLTRLHWSRPNQRVPW